MTTTRCSDVTVATAAVLLSSSALTALATLPVAGASVPTRGLVWLLVFPAALMAGVTASEPFLHRSAVRRARHRGEA
ncbi:hypothetical protein ACWEQL_37110 [Kitasatospora sp. NPDC004240]